MSGFSRSWSENDTSTLSSNNQTNDDFSLQKPQLSNKKIPLMERSLCFAIQSLQNIQILIELKNDSEVRGIVQNSDERMNVLLSQVTLTTSQGKVESYEEMLVKGKSIRYIHFSQVLNLPSLMAQHQKKLAFTRKKNLPVKIRDGSQTRQKRAFEFEEIILDNNQQPMEGSDSEDTAEEDSAMH